MTHITAVRINASVRVYHNVSTNISPASENREKKLRAGHVNNVLSFSSSSAWAGDNLSADEAASDEYASRTFFSEMHTNLAD